MNVDLCTGAVDVYDSKPPLSYNAAVAYAAKNVMPRVAAMVRFIEEAGIREPSQRYFTVGAETVHADDGSAPGPVLRINPHGAGRQDNAHDCGPRALMAMRYAAESLYQDYGDAEMLHILRPVMVLEALTGTILHRNAEQQPYPPQRRIPPSRIDSNQPLRRRRHRSAIAGRRWEVEDTPAARLPTPWFLPGSYAPSAAATQPPLDRALHCIDMQPLWPRHHLRRSRLFKVIRDLEISSDEVQQLFFSPWVYDRCLTALEWAQVLQQADVPLIKGSAEEYRLLYGAMCTAFQHRSQRTGSTDFDQVCFLGHWQRACPMLAALQHPATMAVPLVLSA